MTNWGTVIGMDVSFYQGAIDFHQMKRAGASFVIVKAGQKNYADPEFQSNWLAAKAAGIPRGAYWFYDGRETPMRQAQMFASLLSPDLPEVGAWLDLEELKVTAEQPYKGWANWRICLENLRMRLPRVGIYTAPYFWMTNRPTGADALAFFKSFELWIAHYNVMSPMIPSPWTSAVLWQYGTPPIGHTYGVESIEIDANYFNGDENTFRNYFDLPYQPPTGELPMTWYRVTATAGLNIRSGPGTAYPDIGDLAYNERVETSGGSLGGWMKIIRIYRNSGTMETPATDAYCKDSYLTVTSTPVVEPPPPPPAGNELPASLWIGTEPGNAVEYRKA